MYRIKFEFDEIYVSDIIFTDGIIKKVYLTSNAEEALKYPDEAFNEVCKRAALIGEYFGNPILVQKNNSWADVERY